MFSTILVFAAIIWVVGAAFLYSLARRAPVAFEDDHGFHTVESPKAVRLSPITALRPART